LLALGLRTQAALRQCFATGGFGRVTRGAYRGQCGLALVVVLHGRL